MPSLSLQRWFGERAATLDDLANAHRSVRGSGAGARAATQQINQAYAVLLSAQFQGFCRDLHSECADHLLTPVPDPDLRELLRDNLLFGRKIDRGNPNLATWVRTSTASASRSGRWWMLTTLGTQAGRPPWGSLTTGEMPSPTRTSRPQC